MKRLRLFCAILFPLVACGGDLQPADSPDASTSDSSVDALSDISSTDSPAALVDSSDTGSQSFCQGPAKLSHGASTMENLMITSSNPPLNCCRAVSFTFHSREQLGFNVELMVRAMGSDFVTGSYDLSAPPSWLQVWAGKADVSPYTGVSGRLEIATQPGPDSPLVFSLCGAAQAGDVGTGVEGDRFYFADVLQAPFSWNRRFGLWLLRDPSISAADAAAVPLDSLALSDSPVLGLDALSYYAWSSHTLRLEGYSSASLFASMPTISVFGLPFVVQVDEQRAYLGAFWTPISSLAPDVPFVMVEKTGVSELVIEAPWQGDDPRSDARVKKVLYETRKLAP